MLHCKIDLASATASANDPPISRPGHIGQVSGLSTRFGYDKK
jgi:hypothetical protein